MTTNNININKSPINELDQSQLRHWMSEAIKLARFAESYGDVPIGAVVVHGNCIIGKGYNQVERLQDPTAHAEMIAITAATNALGSKWLHDSILIVTLEPCSMCAGAIVLARIPYLVFAADDPKAGACGSLQNIVEDDRLNHRVQTIKGIMADESSALLKDFFKKLRDKDSVEGCRSG